MMIIVGRRPEPDLTATPVPPAVLPPGYGCLLVEFNRGPMPRPVPWWLVRGALRLRVDKLLVGMGEEVRGDWYVPVPAGEHVVKVVDRLDFTSASTRLTVAPGESYQRYFHFGVWRNQVYDGAGRNVTKFGMLSTWAMIPITLLTIVPACIGLQFWLAALLAP